MREKRGRQRRQSISVQEACEKLGYARKVSHMNLKTNVNAESQITCWAFEHYNVNIVKDRTNA